MGIQIASTFRAALAEALAEVKFADDAVAASVSKPPSADDLQRRGGNVFLLQKFMGHSDLETTKRHAHMTTADLQAVHQRLSLLAR